MVDGRWHVVWYVVDGIWSKAGVRWYGVGGKW